MWCLASRPCWLFTNDSLRLPSHSWPCLGAHQLPHRSTLSRLLAALDQASVEALRSLFQEDLLARKPFAFPGGLFDRTGAQWVVADVDGTRATARQRALPQTDALPAPHRRFDQVCAPGYQGREVRRNRPNPYGPAPGTYTSVFRHGCRDQAMGITEANCDGLLR